MSELNVLSSEEYLRNVNRIIPKVLDLYKFSSEVNIKLLNYSENVTYLLEDIRTNISTVLRINRPEYHTINELNGEIKWLQKIMESKKLEVAEPIAGINGEYVQTIIDAESSEAYNCMLFSFLAGKAPDETNEDNLIKEFEKLGKATALLHDHVQNWEASSKVSRFTWDEDTFFGEKPRWGSYKSARGITKEQIKLFENVEKIIIERLALFGKERARFGLVHADLRLANLLIEEEKIKVIDFDDSGFSWYLYDLGSALSFIEHKPFVPKLVESWLRGYRKVRNISHDEEMEIPTFIMTRRLVLLGWLTSHVDSDTAKETGDDFLEGTEELAKKYFKQFS